MKIANRIDVNEIKQRISIVDLVGQSFEVIGSGHTLTTREHDSLKLFTNNNSWAWFSQTNSSGGVLGGSVIDWYMHCNNCGFKTALRELDAMLNGGTVAPMAKPPVTQVQKVETWQSKQWQADKRRMIDQAQDQLHHSPQDEQGREYLLGRGIRKDIWSAYELGYTVVNNPNVKQKMPAIVIPWQRDQITALEFRFLTDDKKARFSCWGRRYLFGLNRTSSKADRRDDVRQGTSNTILFIEGPLNAISIYQAAYNKFGLDVVSFGSQGSVKTPAVTKIIKAIASNYSYHMVWADEASIARAALDIMPNAYLIKSPDDDDANDILKEGYLVEFLSEALKRFDGVA